MATNVCSRRRRRTLFSQKFADVEGVVGDTAGSLRKRRVTGGEVAIDECIST